MKIFLKNPMVPAAALFLCLLISRYSCAAGILSAVLFVYVRLNRKAALLFAVFPLLLCMPRYSRAEPQIDTGRAVVIGSSYAVIESGHSRVIVYTQEPLLADSIYEISGTAEEIISESGFFRFDSASWAHSLGVYYSLDDAEVSLVKEGNSVRSRIQKKIELTESDEIKTILYKLLLNINISDEDTFLFSSGFSYAGIIALAESIMRYFLDRKTRMKAVLLITFVFCLIYRFPVILCQSLIFRLLSLTDLNAYQKTGFGLSCAMLVYPEKVLTVSFLIPSVYRLCSLIKEERRIISFTAVMLLQGYFFQSMNPLQSFLYPLISRFLGFMYFIALCYLLFPFTGMAAVFRVADDLMSMITKAAISGSPYGAGMIFYIVLCIMCFRSKKRARIICFYLLLFQITGLFHPFAELSLINVGQGDSILIRAPLNTCNILIDTGKPSQWNTLQTYLKAKGITRIDTLIITHSDDDHDGNAERVTEYFRTNEVIREHTEEITAGPFVIYDLNVIENEDENQSSVTSYFSLNGMSVLLTGDCDQYAENEIAEKYSLLHADVLKLSHHGSKTGSSDKFLDTVRPSLALISSGPYSMYHHPSPETVQKLLKRHIPYFDTKNEGDMCIICLPHLNLLICSSGKIAIIN